MKTHNVATVQNHVEAHKRWAFYTINAVEHIKIINIFFLFYRRRKIVFFSLSLFSSRCTIGNEKTAQNTMYVMLENTFQHAARQYWL